MDENQIVQSPRPPKLLKLIKLTKLLKLKMVGFLPRGKKPTMAKKICYNKNMKQILEEILWRLYYASDTRIGRKNDARFALLNDIFKDLHNFTGKQLKAAVIDLNKEKLIQKKKDYEGSILISLTERGMLRAINYKFRRLGDKKEDWDGKWRMVAFDIPKECQKGRKALVYRLKTAGFYELQESIFLYPYDCHKELVSLLNLFKLEKYVRFGLLDFIDNQEKLKFHFKLS